MAASELSASCASARTALGSVTSSGDGYGVAGRMAPSVDLLGYCQ